MERLLQFTMNVKLRCVSWQTELRKGKLPLSTLRFQANDLLHLVTLISELVVNFDRVESLALIDDLRRLQDRHLHDLEARKLLKALEEAAFDPLGQVIVSYLFSGDPSADTWSEVFVVDGDEIGFQHVPSFLSHVADAIIDCGPTARLLRRMGVQVEDHLTARMEEMRSKPSLLLDRSFAHVIVTETRKTLDRLLLQRVRHDGGLLSELSVFRDYFLMAKSEWVTELLEAAGSEELEKPMKVVNKGKLVSMTKRLTTNTVSATFQTFPIDECRSEVKTSDENMLANRAFTLTRETDASLSVVLTDTIAEKYQCIFRHLFFGKCVEMKLKYLWMEFQSIGRNIDVENRLFICHRLTHRMMHFISNYLYYLMIDVIESKDWTNCVEQDSVFAIRDRLDGTLSEILDAFLIGSSSFKSINRVLSTCSLFCTHMTRFLEMNLSETVEDRVESLILLTEQEKYVTMIGKFNDTYESQMNNLMAQLKADSTVGGSGLFGRLDLNGFFTDRI